MLEEELAAVELIERLLEELELYALVIPENMGDTKFVIVLMLEEVLVAVELIDMLLEELELKAAALLAALEL